MIWISFFQMLTDSRFKNPRFSLFIFGTVNQRDLWKQNPKRWTPCFGFCFQDVRKISPILFEITLRTQMVDSYTSKGILQNASYLNKRSPTRASFPTISYIVGYVDHENIARLYRWRHYIDLCEIDSQDLKGIRICNFVSILKPWWLVKCLRGLHGTHVVPPICIPWSMDAEQKQLIFEEDGTAPTYVVE